MGQKLYFIGGLRKITPLLKPNYEVGKEPSLGQVAEEKAPYSGRTD
ncbi:MAG: hypothetical protein ACRCZY_11600 [Phocaeicola sp.]